MPSLNEIAGRVPQRWRRKVPMELRNRIVDRLGHPREPFDPSGFPRRVNVGCGFDVREGWLNVDLHGFHNPDLVADVRSMPDLPSGRYEEVLAQDILEHLPRADADVALREWRRLLQPGGKLHLRVPDLESILLWLQEDDGIEHHRRVIHHCFGTQAYEGDFHLNGFTDVTLFAALVETGFDRISMEIRDGWLWEVDAHAAADPQAVRLGVAFDRGWRMAEPDGGRWGEAGATVSVHTTQPAELTLWVTATRDDGATAVSLGGHALELADGGSTSTSIVLDAPQAGVTRLAVDAPVRLITEASAASRRAAPAGPAPEAP